MLSCSVSYAHCVYACDGTDSGVFAASQEAGDALVEALLKRYGSLLSRTAWCLLGDAQAAQEAVQDTVIAAWRGWSQRQQQGSPRAWLLAILCNQCRKHQRSWSRWWRRHVDLAGVPDPEAPTQDRDEASQHLIRLRAALALLQPRQREVIVLRYLDGHSVEETAAILAIPPGTVKSRCYHALGTLQRLLPNLDLAP